MPLRNADDAALLRRALMLIGLVALALLLWHIRSVLLLVFAAALVAIVLLFIAKPIRRHAGLSEGWALAASTLLLTSFLGGAFWLFGSEVVAQGRELARVLPPAWEDFQARFGFSIDLGALNEAAGSGTGLLFSVANWAFSAGTAVLSLILIVVGGLYIAAAPQLYLAGLTALVPEHQRALATDALTTAGNALRLWLGGQLAAMALVGTLTGLGLWMIGIPAPLALGLLAGIAEFVPLVGPIAAAIPALLVAIGGGFEQVLWTGGLYLLIQQVEANVITPLIQKKAVDLPPALTLFAVVAAGVTFGFMGVLLAAPLTVLTYVGVKRLYVREALGELTDVPGEA